jgi:hypothetical protein
MSSNKHKIPEKMDTAILLQLYQSATLCDHMGDMWDDIYKAFKLAGIELDISEDERWEDYPFSPALTRLGVTTVWGTTLGDDD